MINRNIIKEKHQKNNGFTLAEVMVAMAIALLVLAPILTTLRTQQKSFRTQQQIVEVQQNIRAAMFYLEKSIRMAGYDPFETGDFGFVRKFLEDDKFKMSNDLIAMTADVKKEDGLLDNNYTEKIAYRLRDNALRKYKGGAGWQTVVNSIDALDFVYLGDNGTRLNPAVNASDISKIRVVQVSIVGRTRHPVLDYVDVKEYRNLQGDIVLAGQNDNYQRRILSSEIRCRNVGLF